MKMIMELTPQDVALTIKEGSLAFLLDTLIAAEKTGNEAMGSPLKTMDSRALEQTQIPGQVEMQLAPIAAPVVTIPPVLPVAEPVVQPTMHPVAIPVVTPAAQVVQAVPVAAPTYSMEDLAIAATQLVDAGRREELLLLLSQFGVQALTMLPKEQYGAFASALREKGVKI